MAWASEAVEKVLLGETVRAIPLIQMEFKSGTERVAFSSFPTVVADGLEWVGWGEIISADDIEQSLLGAEAGTLDFTLSGASGIMNEMLAETVQNIDEVHGRLLSVFIAFFDGDWQQVGTSRHLCTHEMQTVPISEQHGENAQTTIGLTTINFLARRARAPIGYLSDASQRLISSDDRFCERVPQNSDKTAVWPSF